MELGGQQDNNRERDTTMTQTSGAADGAKPGAADPSAAYFPDPDVIGAALESAGIGVWAWDIATNRVTWSRNLESIHSLPAGTFDGTFNFINDEIHPDDQVRVKAAIDNVRLTGTPDRILYRLHPRSDRPQIWIESTPTATMVDGQAVKMFGVCRDVSDRVHLHRELRLRASQQEAVARLGERALAETDLQAFFDDTAAMVAEMLETGFVKILELAPGDTEMLLRAGVGWKPGLVGRAHISTLRGSQGGYTIAAGVPVIVENLATETRFESPTLLQDHGVVAGLSCPIAGRDGRAFGVIGAHTGQPRQFSETDVSFLAAVANVLAGAIQRRQLDQRQEILIRELRHRSGNLFSQLLALFSQTAKTSKNIGELVPKYEARVLALANAHRLVTEGGWKSASLAELLNVVLAPYLDRVTFSGPNVFLEADPTFALGIAIHELATNACRHGSLSGRAGRVEMTWQVERTDLGMTLMLNWVERGGPRPKRQPRTGFGSRLITMVIERQLNGTVHMSFGPSGLDVALTVPLTHERWPGASTRTAPTTDLP